MDYTHLYIPKKFDYHFNPGAESCISEIKFLKCNDRINDNILSILTKTYFNIYYYKESLFHVSFYSYVKWDNLFNILAKSSPSSLFEFVFKYTDENPELESLKLFFDNWESRFPISLKFKKERDYYYESGYDDLVDLIEIYKEKGVIKNFVHYHYDEDSDLLEIYKTKRVINNPESVIKNSEIKSTSIWNRFKKKFNKYPW
ncbi:unnamed protein product [Rhizophagus irregularis]|nr:unnamed protein product [Rhizophagus irregularis]